MAFIYWIHLKEHTDIFTQGYVGYTTKTVDRRFSEHVRFIKTNDTKRSSPVLYNAANKYGLENLVVSTIVECDTDYALYLENALRPKDKIGWNLMVGGIKAPEMTEERRKMISDKNKGLKRTDLQKRKLSESHKGKVSKLKGVKLDQHKCLTMSLNSCYNKKIFCPDLQISFLNSKYASLYLKSIGFDKADHNSIRKVASGIRTKAYGFTWVYI